MDTLKRTDLEFLQDFTRGDVEKTRKYISMYLKTAPPEVIKMQDLLERGDFETLKRSAHGLKTQARYMGAELLSDTMFEIEQKAEKESNKEELRDLINKALQLNEEVETELKAYLESI